MTKVDLQDYDNLRIIVSESESQNCRGWKDSQEFIESNAPAKAGSLQ